MVIELRPPGSDKGQALETLARARSAAAVMYCGDDLGDSRPSVPSRNCAAKGSPAWPSAVAQPR